MPSSASPPASSSLTGYATAAAGPRSLNQLCRIFQGSSQRAHLRVQGRVAILGSMSNMYNGIGADEIPTAPYRVPGAAPGGPGFGSGSGAGKNGGKGGWLRGKRAAAIVAVCAAVAGGAFAIVQAATGSPAPQPAANTQAL